MSTYLVAFIVGEYDFIEEKCPNNMPVRVYTPIGKQDMGIFSLDVTRQFTKIEIVVKIKYFLNR
jgi:aminopeptidase N